MSCDKAGCEVFFFFSFFFLTVKTQFLLIKWDPFFELWGVTTTGNELLEWNADVD